ncbi:MAG: RND transporter [Leptothrix sp. (in: Bacteria)]|nr:RND transporter [Leptothrix sp. (in: b-proteobacteria)]
MGLPRTRSTTLPLTALALSAAFTLVGCASLQQPRATAQTVPVPAAWAAAGASAAAPVSAAADTPARSLADWWRRFDEPVLPALVEQALTGSTDIATAQARLAQARAQRNLAVAGRRPAVSGSGSAQASRRDGGTTTRQYGLDIDARWEADLWGGRAAGVRAADATAEASAATLAATRVSVAAEVALNLLQLRGTQARLAIAEDNLDSQRQTLQIVGWRAAAGLVTQLDVEQARTAVEQTRAQIPALQTGAGQAMNALAVLTGQAPGALAATLAPATPARAPHAPPALALALPAEVLRQRPDVRAAEQRLQAAAAQVEQGDAERLPSLALSGSLGLNALSLGALGSGAGVASLLAGVSAPLFDAGRLRAQVRQQEGARDEAEAAYRATLLTALQEVEDTLIALRGTREQQAPQQAAATAAQNAARLAVQRYRSGLVDFQNVLQTQRTLLSAQDSLAATATTLATQHVRLYKVLGGGWTPTESTSTPVDAKATAAAPPPSTGTQ